MRKQGAKMELNEDGLIPGQSVDFDTIMRVNRAREKKQTEPQEDQPQAVEAEKPRTRRSRKDAA
jgi:hypothetical protein